MYGQILLFCDQSMREKAWHSRKRRTLLAGAACELAGATRLRQARPLSAYTFSVSMIAYVNCWFALCLQSARPAASPLVAAFDAYTMLLLPRVVASQKASQCTVAEVEMRSGFRQRLAHAAEAIDSANDRLEVQKSNLLQFSGEAYSASSSFCSGVGLFVRALHDTIGSEPVLAPSEISAKCVFLLNHSCISRGVCKSFLCRLDAVARNGRHAIPELNNVFMPNVQVHAAYVLEFVLS